jgi:hypothetical protein
MRSKKMETVKRELPMLLCSTCRLWIETQERHNMFVAVDGVPQKLAAWTCPRCRGVEGVEVKVAEPAKTAADVAHEERLGPYRKVVGAVNNPGGRSARVTLDCGHVKTAPPKATRERCRKCLKKSEPNV